MELYGESTTPPPDYIWSHDIDCWEHEDGSIKEWTTVYVNPSTYSEYHIHSSLIDDELTVYPVSAGDNCLSVINKPNLATVPIQPRQKVVYQIQDNGSECIAWPVKKDG